MKNLWIIVFAITLGFTSCKKEGDTTLREQEKQKVYNDSVFNHLDKSWKIKVPKGSQSVSKVLEDWKPWVALVNELKLKPVATIGAFQKKASALSEVAVNLTFQGYPVEVDYPDIKARYSTLLTSIQNLDMYINNSPIDLEKVDFYLKEVQANLNELVKMMDEDQIRMNYEKEEGEEEMVEEMRTMMIESRRANPEEE